MRGKKTGGRAKGTPNKVTANLREFYNALVIENMEQIREDLKELEPKARLMFLERVTRYILPTYQSIAFSEPGNKYDHRFIICVDSQEDADYIKERVPNTLQISNSELSDKSINMRGVDKETAVTMAKLGEL